MYGCLLLSGKYKFMYTAMHYNTAIRPSTWAIGGCNVRIAPLTGIFLTQPRTHLNVRIPAPYNYALQYCNSAHHVGHWGL